MAKTRVQKEQIVADLADRLKKMKVMVMASVKGVPVSEAVSLRKTMGESAVDLIMIKKRLFKLALAKANISDVPLDQFTGTIGIAFSNHDEVIPAKLLAAFKKDHDEQLQFLGGVMNGAFIGVDQVKALSALPSYPEMLAQTVWTIAAPVSGFVNVVAGIVRSMLNVLSAVRDSKEVRNP